ncbi:hypothetical protein [Planctobacterium marinum]|uniref:hypothetical protein n=1 Tax=Planctobacterium marinum TaxID=1631968 RepID=UPI001E51C2EA|nr:hypothetical protein [Planctobacterium marinum]MCC2605624.1 hypothetical protein [Planctobacterium marinum]
MRSAGIPRIKEFPADDQYWRVDWFGAVKQNPNIPTEPYIQILISPLAENSLIHSEPKDLASSRSVIKEKQQTILIGSGQLPLISIGSIWHNGYCQPAKAGNTEIIYGLDISPETTQVISGGHKVEDKYLIPPNFYTFGKATGAKLVAIKQGADPYGVLIPMMELVRSYYALSTDLSHALFAGHYKHDLNQIVNFEKCGFLKAENKCVVHLRQHMSDEDGWIIGRILNSLDAWRGATLPHDSMMKNAVNNQYAYIESQFPFQGTTNITVRFKRIKSLKDNSWRTLVLSIDHCSAAFPFKDMLLDRDNNNLKGDPANALPADQKKPAFPKPNAKTSKGDKPLQSKNEPDNQCSNERIPLPTDKFSALAGKRPEKPTKEQCEYMSKPVIPSPNKPSNELGTGSGGKKQNGTGKGNLDQHRTRRKGLPASFKVFEEAISLLNKKDGFSARLRALDESTEYIPLTKPATQRQWSYLDSETYTRRQVIIADIYHAGKWYSLIEFELRKSDRCNVALCYSSSGQILSNQLMNRILFQAARSRGVWQNIEQLRILSVDIESMKHTWSSESDFYTSVHTKILKS